MTVKKPFLIGLTGSIGMGKSTTAQMFADLGVPVWDADAAVHRLYANGGAAVGPMQQLYPGAIIDGAVDRDALKQWISSDPRALRETERIVHPLVATDRQAFIDASSSDILLLYIPLLFETNTESTVDTVVTVTAPADLQRARVLERAKMTKAQFDTILAKQTPDAEKRARADYIIETITLAAARAAVQSCLTDIRRKLSHA